MKRLACSGILIACMAMPVSAETLILASPEEKACGPHGYSYKSGYTLESVDPSGGTLVSKRLAELVAAKKGAGVSKVHTATVSPKNCVAVAFMDKKVGTCEWRTFTWKVAGDAETAQAAVEKVLASEVNLKNSGVQEVRCAMPPKPPESKDTAWAIRG